MSTQSFKYYALTWQCFRFEDLSNHLLYELLKLRTEIFVVEQNCAYLDTDGYDCHPDTHHLIGMMQNEIIAASRLLPAGLTYPSASIGRIVVAKKARSCGLGHQLLIKTLAHCERLWPKKTLTIGAQYHLRDFYKKHKFEIISKPYDEDGILHVDMHRKAK